MCLTSFPRSAYCWPKIPPSVLGPGAFLDFVSKDHHIEFAYILYFVGAGSGIDDPDLDCTPEATIFA